MRLLLLCIVICVCSPSGYAQSTVPLAEAERQIQSHITYLESRKTDLDKLYLGRNALNTLNQIRAKSGLPPSNGPTDEYYYIYQHHHGLRFIWGNEGHGFYDYHIEALQSSLRFLRDRKRALATELDYLNNGMAALKRHDPKIAEVFAKLADTYAKQTEFIGGRRPPVSDQILHPTTQQRFFEALSGGPTTPESSNRTGERPPTPLVLIKQGSVPGARSDDKP